MPFFSIIIPTYNRAHRLPKAIASILDQTFEDYELIIIDDASTDKTEELIKTYNDPRIHYIKNETNQERCNSRNTGIKAAKGEYICFLDSDDYHLPHHLETLAKAINENSLPADSQGELKITNYESTIVSEANVKINNKKQKLRDLSVPQPPLREPQPTFYFTKAYNETEDGLRTERVCPDFTTTDPYTYFLRYTVNPQRWCVHRTIFEKVQFDPEVIICEDMDTSLRIAAAGYNIQEVPERATIYVAAKDSFTYGDSQKWEKELFYLQRIFKKKELKNQLPKKENKRLLSVCHFHLAQKAIENKQRWIFYKHAFLSFFLYPKGYKANTNKILLVNGVYFFPLVRKLWNIKFLSYIRKTLEK